MSSWFSSGAVEIRGEADFRHLGQSVMHGNITVHLLSASHTLHGHESEGQSSLSEVAWGPSSGLPATSWYCGKAFTQPEVTSPRTM